MPIGDRAKEEIIVSSETKQIFRRVAIKTNGKSLEGVTFDNCLFDKDLHFTNGTYEVIYRPASKQIEHAKNNPFIIRCDMYPGAKKRIASWEAFQRLAKSDPVTAWLIKWTTIDKELFKCAKTHYMLPLTFTIKYTEYWRYLEKLEPDARMHLSREEWMIGEKYRAERLASR